MSREIRGKVVVVGEYGSGKTALVRRFTDREFTASAAPTVSPACHGYKLMLDKRLPPVTHIAPLGFGAADNAELEAALGWTASAAPATPGGEFTNFAAAVTLDVWDTAGSERYAEVLQRMYYRDAAAALVVFDATDRATLRRAAHWAAQYRQRGGGKVFLVAAKMDRFGETSPEMAAAGEKPVTVAEMREEAAALGATLALTSALQGVNVDALFRAVAAHVSTAGGDVKPRGEWKGSTRRGFAGTSNLGAGLGNVQCQCY
jgi:small GTP-binding protein